MSNLPFDRTHTHTHKTPIQPITIAPAISNPMIIPAVYCFVFQLPERFIRQIENHSKSLLHIQHFFLCCWTQFKRSFARKTNIQLNNNFNSILDSFRLNSFNITILFGIGTVRFACDFYRSEHIGRASHAERVNWKYNFNFFYDSGSDSALIHEAQVEIWNWAGCKKGLKVCEIELR